MAVGESLWASPNHAALGSFLAIKVEAVEIGVAAAAVSPGALEALGAVAVGQLVVVGVQGAEGSVSAETCQVLSRSGQVTNLLCLNPSPALPLYLPMCRANLPSSPKSKSEYRACLGSDPRVPHNSTSNSIGSCSVKA